MGTYLVHHDIMRDYMFHFLYSGTSMYNFHNSWMEILTDCGTLDTLPYKRFRWAWHAYLNLLDIPAAEGFYCPKCRDNPRSIVMDGTTLGYHQRYSAKHSTEVAQQQDGPSHRGR
ncbi:hypothetical protein SKAU_G00276710 [Synaphobranchus kaupii]|uniref:Uncharacterized protein n=1 Tax=Synaphobranchus kaupii TaxID=118154 RepID=A0A9Q1IQY0_SYNKA|nr:hypothetical protein SKAU_G00276710 [Synaphobranchus kaupii]